MAKTFADMLQSGGGDLTPALFPQLSLGTTLDAFLNAKLAEGYAKASAILPALSAADADAAAMAWAYYMAYLAVWMRLSASPADVDVAGEVKRSFLASQIQTFRDLANEYFARFEQFVPLPAGDSSANVVVTSVATKFRRF
jgi:hypothetical protein